MQLKTILNRVLRRQLAFPSERQLERPGGGVLAGLLFRVSDN